MSAKILPGQFDRWLQNRVNEQLSDAALLERFCVHRDETAFAGLVQRHGPMVRAVCGRALADPHDLDDAFQATFLVLVKKAKSIRKQASVAAWLHGVARRVSFQARSRKVRQPQLPSDGVPEPAAASADGSRDDHERLDHEIERLPEKYRLPVALCYLEGRTLDQAALQLGWPKGTVAGRLARAKELLKCRLTRLGVGAATVAALDASAAAQAAAAVPSALAEATVLAAQALGTGGEAAQISASALLLMKGALAAMTTKKLMTWSAAAAVLLLAGSAAWVAGGDETRKSQRSAGSAAVPPPSGRTSDEGKKAKSEEALTDETAWCMVFSNGAERKAVRSDGKTVFGLPAPAQPKLGAPPKPAQKESEIDVGGGQKIRIPNPQPPADWAGRYVLSPDRSKIAFIGDVKDGKGVPHPYFGHLCLAAADGSEPIALTNKSARRTSLSWSPDGERLAFDEDTGEKLKLDNAAKGGFDYGPEDVRRVQVMTIEGAAARTALEKARATLALLRKEEKLEAATAQDLNIKKLQYEEAMQELAKAVKRRTYGGGSESFHSPQFTPRGRLSYLVARGRNGKLRLDDLVVRILDGVMSADALKPHTLVEKQWILGFAFSPDESKLAYSDGSVMHVKNLEKPGVVTYSMATLNQHLGKHWAVCFTTPVWRPDGKALACRCAFMGGRSAGRNGQFDESPIPGEEQVIVFSADDAKVTACEPEAFAFDVKWHLTGWLTNEEAAKLRGR